MQELSSRSGVSASTIKYYVKEGLVDIACKTGPNMAYYHPDSVARVKRIKMMQTVKYYPLAVIKRLIDSNEFDAEEIELLDVIHKTGRDSSITRYSFDEALRISELDRAQAEALIDAGVVQPLSDGDERLFRESDCRMLALVKARLNAGIPFSQTLSSFRAYTEVLSRAARQDIEGLIVDPLISSAHNTGDIVRIIRTSDDTLNEFIMLKRYEFNSIIGSERITALSAFIAALRAYVSDLVQIFSDNGYAAQASLLQSALQGASDESDSPCSAVARVMRHSSHGLALSLAACSQANAILQSGIGANGTAAESAAYADVATCAMDGALRSGWRTLVPEEFGGNERYSFADAMPAITPAMLDAISQAAEACRDRQKKQSHRQRRKQH